MNWNRTTETRGRHSARRCGRAPFLFAMAAIAAAAAFGTPRALLIGVSYKTSSGGLSPLQGIDLDVNRMEQTALDLGIADIRRLEDEEATLQGIRTAMRQLAESVGPDDLTLIYFSGHGAQVPDRGELDEEDARDETLLPSDARLVIGSVPDSQGKPKPEVVDIENGLVDDEFYQMLGQIRSNRVLLVIDACNSGTSARGIGITPKFVAVAAPRDAGTKSPGSSRSFSPAGPGTTAKFIGIMAAQDHEFALATPDGSVLTNALHRSISAARNAGTANVTVQDLFERVNRDVASEMSARFQNHPQHPNLFVPAGSEALRGLSLLIVRGARGGPTLDPPEDDPLIRRWMDYAARAGRRVELAVPRQVFTLHPDPTDKARVCDPQYSDHLLSIEVEAPDDGYLNVLNAGQGERDPIVLFPNGRSMQDNRVRRGQRVVIPPAGTGWCLPASSIPEGLDSQWVLVVAAFSRDPLNFYRDGTGGGPFRTASKDAYRSFPVGGPGPDGASGSEHRITAAATAQVLIRRH